MKLDKSDLEAYWVPLPPTQAIATSRNALITDKLQVVRRTQDKAVSDRAQTSKTWWGVTQGAKSPLNPSIPPVTLHWQLETELLLLGGRGSNY